MLQKKAQEDTGLISYLLGIVLCKTETIKGCEMDTLFVLVSPCFRENVVVTCNMWYFLCSLDNLLQKNVIVFFSEIQFQNMALN